MRAIRLIPTLSAAVLAIAPAFCAEVEAGRRQVGKLLLDGIPEIPAAIVERLNPYGNVRSASLTEWSPQGGGIIVLTRFGETNQAHEVAAPGGYRRQLTFHREPIHDVVCDPRRTDGFYFRSDAGGGEFYQYYWFDRRSGAFALATDGASRNESLRAAREGGAIAYVSTRRNRRDFDIYVQKGPDPATARLVKQVEGQWSILDWSPDSRRLLAMREISINESAIFLIEISSGEAKEINPSPGKKIRYESARFLPGTDAVLYASDEGGEFVRLTRYELATGRKTVVYEGAHDVEAIAVSRDGSSIAFSVNDGGASSLFLARAGAAAGEARTIAVPLGVASDLSFDLEGRRVGFTMSTSTASADVYVADTEKGEAVRWTASEVGGLDPERFVTPELIRYRSFDGREIPAWLYKPRAGTAPFPALIQIHGGPESQARPSFAPAIQYWVNELGLAVLVPNVRGSTGYGRTYTLLDNGMKREDSVRDIGALLDWIGAQKDLDPRRVGVLGGSYGGYMVLATMIRYGERLRCAVDIVGISNFVTFLERTEEYRRDLRRVEYGDERDPAMRAFLLEASPLTHAAKIAKPLFVAAGRNDPRVPLAESEQIVGIARANGGVVWYLVADDEGHGFAKKTNRDFFAAATSLFLERYLLR